MSDPTPETKTRKKRARLAEVFRLKISPDELEAWTKAKPPHQKSLSKWIRGTLNDAAK